MNPPSQRRRQATRGRRQTVRCMISLYPEEARRLYAWARRHGLDRDNLALRKIVMERVEADKIKDPGPGSPEGQPLTSPWRQTLSTDHEEQQPEQLAVVA